MKYEITVSDHKTYLNIRINESVTVKVLEDFISQTAGKSKKYEIDNFLFDLRHAPNRTGLFDHYYFVYRRSKELGFSPKSKHALVVSPENMVDYGFIETILKNAGYRSKMFLDELAAIEWLEK
jgi:hypothetical protein